MLKIKNGLMLRIFTSLLVLAIPSMLPSQEICNNAMDDDGDGLIDLKDPDCDCSNLLRNGDFEELLDPATTSGYAFSGLFDRPAMVPAYWNNVIGRPQYSHKFLCGNYCDSIVSGEYGLYLRNTGGPFHEMVGTCLSEPLEGGRSYIFSFNVVVGCDFTLDPTPGGKCDGDYREIMYVYGVPSCRQIIDTSYTDCAAPNTYGLELIDTIRLPSSDYENGELFIRRLAKRLMIPVNKRYEMFFLGFPCQSDLVFQSNHLDNLSLIPDPYESLGVTIRDTCRSDVELFVHAFYPAPPPDATFQWYRNNIALPTATDYSLKLKPGDGAGDYTVIWSYQGICGRGEYTYAPTTVDLEIHSSALRICPGDSVKLSVDSTDFTSYTWNTGALSPSIAITKEGKYEAAVTWTHDQRICMATLGIIVEPGDNIPVQILTLPGGNSQTGFIEIQTSLNLLGVTWADGFPGLLRRTGLDTGTYCVTLERANFCPLDTCITITSFPDSLVCVEEITHPSCPQATDGIIRLDLAGGFRPFRVVLNGEEYNTDTSIVFQGLSSGDYVWKVIDASGDSCTGTLSLQDTPMGWDVVSKPAICPNGRNGMLEIRPAVNSGGIEVWWPDGINSLERLGLSSGVHSFLVVQGTCSVPDSALVGVLGEPQVIKPQTGLESCDDRSGYIDFGFLDLPGDPRVGLIGQLQSASGYFGGLKLDSMYTFWIRSPEGCTDTIQVVLPDYPFPFLVIHVEDSMSSVFRLGLDLNFTPVKLEWENLSKQTMCSGCPEWVVIQNSTAQLIRVTATDSSGCEATDTLVIGPARGDAIYLPNIFTPNGDLINDTWEVSAVNAMPYRILIRDRWGNVILDQKGEDLREISWDGTSDGRLVLPGVYLVQLLLYPDTLRQRLVNETITLVR